ncbi:hypothetical protein [Martelella alba]|uniref:Holin n=1 Tax=Martelella alba TaxID=2590451 RepID=A0ABY2SF91_9HYPH|nr:hypothetical protein [Martelella alba]TKI03561.1 hypothetical protein FCN80_21015 [Martelella alba]
MYRMNDKSDIATHGGALVTLLSSLMGLTTMEMFYIVIALIGAVISLLGYLDKRKTEKLNRSVALERAAFDQQRTKAIVDFLKGSPSHDSSQAAQVVQKVNQILVETEQTDGNVTAAEE